jgi:Putative phage serine protease XkdF
MSIQKAHFDIDGNNVRISMPLTKVDTERRIVSGFATLDNIDKQNDIVTPEASLNAFSKFRGNIREMHQPKAVGKMVAFKEDKYFDPETKKFYQGIYVSAYISKGAQDAWEKVIDGTYTGFSIGGKMNKWDDAYDEKIDASIRVIKDYDLVELSLVDSPANQFANILSVEKVDGVDTITGEGTETILENVFWDKESGLVVISEDETAVSPTTGNNMQNIGFVEKSDDDKLDMVKFLVDSAKGINTSKTIKKENDNMSDEIVKDEIVNVAPEAEVVVDAPATEEVVEEAPVAEPAHVEEVVEDVPGSEEVIAKAVAELGSTVTTAFSDISAIVKSLADANASLLTELAELKKSVGFVTAKVTDAESDFTNLGKRIDAVEADTAFRKSGDLGEVFQEPVLVEKSVWGGSFLTTSDLLK